MHKVREKQEYAWWQNRTIFCALAVVFSFLVATSLFSPVYAQAGEALLDDMLNEAVAVDVKTPQGISDTNARTAGGQRQVKGFDPNAPASPTDIPSLFFTYWQHEAIIDAKDAINTRAPTGRELNQIPGEEKTRPPPEERELRLGGIVYVNENDWTIWLNNKRVTPDAVPKEVLDLRVHREYIEMKWLDEYTNGIFPVRLRPNQRFNMDMRIFLPG